MKILKQTLFYSALCLTIVLTSCNKDDDGNENNNNNAGAEFLTAKVDGSDFAASLDPA